MPLKLEAALRALPDAPVLAGLRETLISLARARRAASWAVAGEYETLERREAELEGLAGRLQELAEQARERTERIHRHSLEALQALEQGDPAAAARALVAAGEVLEANRELEEAESFFRQAVQLGRKPRDRSAQALAHCRLARVLRARGSWPQALREYRTGWEVAEAERARDLMVLACQGCGNVHVDLGEWSLAREWYLRGLEVLAGSPPGRAEWELCSNLSIVARRSGSLAESEGWLLRAAQTAGALGDEEVEFFVANGWGQLHLARGDPRAAEESFRQALGATRHPHSRAATFVNLGESLLLQGRLDDAEQVAREAEETALLHRVLTLLPDAYRLLGRVAGERGQRDGFVFFEQALALEGENGPARSRAETQHRYGEFQARMGDTDSAAARLREAAGVYRALGAARELEGVEAALAELGGTTERTPAEAGFAQESER